ncbi:MAG: PEP/pyruvate-binding domain-containing protein [Acidobacteria bacterium]|nr:PEP/pyruvate-binding domain-containing protein [Acidobacteriota bacterium]
MSNFLKLTCLSILTLVLGGAPAAGQLSRKPSPLSEPPGVMNKKPDTQRDSLPRIESPAEFDLIGRVYHQGTPYALPHVMFVIDRRDGNKIYYVNSQLFRFHKDFLFAKRLVAFGTDIYKSVYATDDRRFIVGTVAWQKPVEKWTWELWEGDLANAGHLRIADETINRTFFEKVYYKPNSIRQEDVAATVGLDRVTQDELNKNQEYLALNTGKTVGRVHIVDKLDDTVEIGDNEIIILKELPVSLPPVRGIIVAKPSTPLSHINILAKGWNIPNVYVKDADKLYREYDTWWVEIDATLTDFSIKPIKDPKPIDNFCRQNPDKCQQPREAPADLKVKTLTPLGRMRKKDSLAFGSKSANLGEMLFAKAPGFTVPDGFTVPFYWYAKFMRDNGFDKVIDDLTDDNDFVHNPRYRRQKLEEFRAKIQKGAFDEGLKKEIVAKWKTQLGGKPVFVRSSSNSEDLPNFSGAGLYSSVPNVTQEDALIEAVKKVWASLWKFEAYEARVRNYVDQDSVYMSALIQLGVDMEKGGVMISKDPFDKFNKNAVYISAVCGHNSKIPDNNGIPEQILFNPRSNSVAVMTLSQQENSLKFDAGGGLVETPDTCVNKQTKRVLTDLQARALAKIALAIRRVFGGDVEQDIEWGIMNGRVYIVQARPYIEKN